ncbi:MAG: hypothetical protein KME11_01940 [Timaviella obliquedivisa GSE-PSE-MK23-08B]|jgi:hypothetical protein|nr:hypothetical protein [Timaviella obliquedivisa GSE-PSE-MK23-08B]
MENWQQDWVKNVETAAISLERFFQDASKEMGSGALILIEFSDEVIDEIEQAIAPAIEQLESQLTEWLDPFLELGAELESFLYELQWIDQISDFTDFSAESLSIQHPICQGCRHYHGEVYNGTPFICAMHPYGVVDGAEFCADKEAIVWRLPFSATDSSEDDF